MLDEALRHQPQDSGKSAVLRTILLREIKGRPRVLVRTHSKKQSYLAV